MTPDGLSPPDLSEELLWELRDHVRGGGAGLAACIHPNGTITLRVAVTAEPGHLIGIAHLLLIGAAETFRRCPGCGQDHAAQIGQLDLVMAGIERMLHPTLDS